MSNPKARVLVVDDEDSSRVGLARLLTLEGYSVQTATDGVGALQLVAEGLPDVVIADFRMPNMDGVELIQQLRERFPALPVIMTTGLDDVAAAEMARRAGAEHYFLKPIDIDELQLAIDRAVGQRR